MRLRTQSTASGSAARRRHGPRSLAALGAALVATAGLAVPAATVATTASAAPAAATPAASGDDWLHTDGNQIVDADGTPVWLTGVNWFGYNAGERVFHGLWSANIETLTRQMAERGLNVVRVPFSTELMLEWAAGETITPNVNTYANPELTGMDNKEVFDYWLTLCEKYGLKVIVDAHSAAADNAGHVAPMWYNTAAGITTQDFYDGWAWFAQEYKDDDTIVAVDLENEPHGKVSESPRAKWDSSTDPDNWKHAAEQAAARVLAANPNLLILVEGNEVYPKAGVSWASTTPTEYHSTWWGGNLRGADTHPIDLGAHQDQLVYSPHDYGPAVYQQPWFSGTWSRATLERDVWDPNWLYLHKNGTAPLLIGEWGGFLDGGDNEKWMLALREAIVDYRLHHTFWCLNPNSGDTGGLLGYDWATWDEAKYALLKPALWAEGGKFVSLDHQVPLGGAGSTTGISVADLDGGGSPTPTPSVSPTPTPTPTVSPSPTPTVSHSPTLPPSTCTAALRVVNSWSGGYQAEVTVSATSARTGWSTQFTLPAGATLGSVWSATHTVSGSTVTVSNAAWNGAIGPGTSATYGFTATGTPPTSVSCA